MRSAHLHAVPEPEPGPDEEPTPGEEPSPVPTADPAGGDQLDDVEPGPNEEAAAGEHGSPGAAPPLDHDEDQEDEEDPPGDPWWVVAWKYLGLYSDGPTDPVYGPLLVKAARYGGPILLRALLVLARGLRVVGSSLHAWVSGDGPGPAAFGLRVLCVLGGIYAAVRMAGSHPAGPWVAAAAALVVATAAGLVRRPAPAENETDAGPGKSKRKGKAGASSEAAPSSARAAQKEKVAGARNGGGAVGGMLARFGLRRGPDDAPPDPAGAASEQPPNPAPEPPVEDPAQAPLAPRPMTLIEALHHPRHGGRGVLLTALRDDLQLPHTRDVQAALDEAGIRWRRGVRTAAGNGPAVHPSDVPPLPSAQDLPGLPTPTALVQVSAPTTTANNTANNSANTPEERLPVESIDFGAVTITRDPTRHFRVEPAPKSNESTGS
ncbi:hypothetical protein [Embleya sp. NPDC001921]